MKIGIIDIGWKEIDKSTFSSQALGGSETWLLSATKSLTNLGHQVEVYCTTKEKWTDKNGTNYIPLYEIIDSFVQQPKYDFIILNRIIRRFNTDIITLIRQYNVTDSIFLQMHDLSLLYEDHLANERELQGTGIFDPRVKGLIFLTQWHLENFERQYPILNSLPKYIIPNGVDLSMIPVKKEKTDHRLLWSSCAERGLDILVGMYDEIRKEVPDFGIDVAGYNDLSGINVVDKDVKVLGNLNKERLYQEMNKHSVWFYPGTFAETFCITMMENLACGNMIISPFTYGTRGVVNEEYIKAVHDKYGTVGFFDAGYPGRPQSMHNASKSIIKAFKEYDVDIAMLGKHIAKQYTWDNTARSYISLFKHLTYKDREVKHKYKGLFLSQSCNIDFFKRESEAMEETWPKDLLEGKYEGYTYFRFTSCDEEHPEPCIEGHVIYVVNNDGMYSTYEKMRDVYRLLLENGYGFEKIFRTNTSTFINVPKAIAAMNRCEDNQILSDICGYYHCKPNGDIEFQFNTFTGNAYVMPKTIADKVFLSNYDSHISAVSDGDDIIAAKILNELTNPGDIKLGALNIDPNGNPVFCRRYKFTDFASEDNNGKKDDPENRYTDNPYLIKDYVSMSYRMNSLDYKDREIEFERIKEINDAYTKTL